jgi:hypothetical protein
MFDQDEALGDINGLVGSNLIEAACGKLRQVRFRWRGGGSCTVEDTVCATVGREVLVLCVCLC